jgi:predicted O-methyltransferase YrrM
VDGARKRIAGHITLRPWMLLEEADVIGDLLLNLRPKRCLEWGAGASSLYFTKFLSPDARWLAIEHDQSWAAHLLKLARRPIVEITHVAPNCFKGDGDCGDGSYSTFSDYIEYPEGSAKYDFILVDGMARNECLIKAQTLLAPGGVIVLHDANCPEFHAGTALYTYQFMLTGRGTNQNGIWVGSMDIPIEDVLNVQAHRRIWTFYLRLRRLLRR